MRKIFLPDGKTVGEADKQSTTYQPAKQINAASAEMDADGKNSIETENCRAEKLTCKCRSAGLTTGTATTGGTTAGTGGDVRGARRGKACQCVKVTVRRLRRRTGVRRTTFARDH